MRFKRWHDYAGLAIIATILIVAVCCCSGCLGWRSISPEDAAKEGGAIGAFFGPWGAPIGAAIAYITALAARKIERDRMIARHLDTVQGLTQTISTLEATARTTPAVRYSPNDQNPINGDGLEPHP